MGEWQPIDTAPLDGTAVLLAGGDCNSDDKFYRAVAWKDASEPSIWLVSFYDDGWGLIEYHNPTHWMPLPDPPETA